MAWTKMKTAVVAGACVLIATGTTLVTMKHIRHYKADLIARKVTGQPPQKESDLKEQPQTILHAARALYNVPL
jgi:hypothetical protein